MPTRNSATDGKARFDSVREDLGVRYGAVVVAMVRYRSYKKQSLGMSWQRFESEK